MSLTVIGDVHCKYRQYLEITKKHEYTLQLGDFGFQYDCLDEVDSTKHLVFSGNHDNIPKLKELPHNLGEYGYTSINGIQFFFVRGGYSIDVRVRRPGVDWFDEEELSFRDLTDAVYVYERTKPDIVITHEAPSYVSRAKGDAQMLQSYGLSSLWTSKTGQALQGMLHLHTPKLWIHGHLHTSYQEQILGCKFVGLTELETFTVEK